MASRTITTSGLVLAILVWTLATAQGQHKASKGAVIPQLPEAPTGFDNKSNGAVDDQTHQADQAKFDEVENIADGLGPLYNAQSCRECHQTPTSGGPSQVTELRVGHVGPDRRFHNPEIPIARGTETISGRTLVNDRAICPNGAFADTEIQERVPDSETVRTTRVSLNLLGDGFVEAVPDRTLIDLARNQCRNSHGKICGVVIYVPIVESTGQAGVGRFGWKNQHASLLSFSGDAYLNEMGVTTQLFPDEITKLCNTVSEPNDKPGALRTCDSPDAEGVYAREFPEDAKPHSYCTALGSAPEYAADARRNIDNVPRCYSSPRRRGGASNARVSQVGSERTGSDFGIPKIALILPARPGMLARNGISQHYTPFEAPLPASSDQTCPPS